MGWWVVAARLANTLFFLLTATYCILTYSSFAYQQFIRPRMVSSLSGFVALHHLWHWVMLGVTVATLLPEWKTSRGRAVAWGYVAAMAAVGLFMIYRPVLPSVENEALGLWLAVGFLVPPIWLAAYDHLATRDTFAPAPADTRRFVTAAVVAALVVWAANALTTPFRFAELGDYTTGGAALTFGVIVSLAVHVGLFTTMGLLLAVLLTQIPHSAKRGARQYAVVALIAGAACLAIVKGLVFEALSFTGGPAWLVATETALALTLTWSALAHRLSAARPAGADDACAAWLSPVPGVRHSVAAVFGLVVVSGGILAVLPRVEQFDWHFLVQNLLVVLAWLLTLALVHAAVRPSLVATAKGPATVAALAVVSVAGVSAGGGIEKTMPGSRQFVPEFVLDAYATVDPSYRLMRQFLATEPPGSSQFYSDIAEQSLIEHVDVKPVDVNLVSPLTPAPEPPPHIFFFVIDSLRRDYLSPYNPRVTFTPSFDAFAREDIAFTKSFTRYGGTGLSMPAIWAGSMILHKEYVLPFQPMNLLEKLLTVNRYRLMWSPDHITTEIVSPSLAVEPLDQGRPEMEYDFCATLEELGGKLERGAASEGPVFAHTRSLNLHISKLTERVGAPDPAYGGFQAPAAAAVRRMDGCFGQFMQTLKTTGLYDRSIVILTSDHGDALGEARRWGHAYTLFPEIVRTPLLMHIPSALQTRFTTDRDLPVYSTDITPTLYTLLGYEVPPREWPLGRSFYVRPGEDQSWRQTEPALLASSYGAVYGVLRDNGRSLYIADGVNRRDYAYDLTRLKPVRIGVTDSARHDGRTFIHASLDRLAALYHYAPAH